AIHDQRSSPPPLGGGKICVVIRSALFALALPLALPLLIPFDPFAFPGLHCPAGGVDIDVPRIGPGQLVRQVARQQLGTVLALFPQTPRLHWFEVRVHARPDRLAICVGAVGHAHAPSCSVLRYSPHGRSSVTYLSRSGDGHLSATISDSRTSPASTHPSP